MQGLVIHDQIEAYHRERSSLMTSNTDSWVVFAEAKFQSRFPSFEQAYRYAVGNFGSGEYLIRDLNAAEPFVPMVFVPQ